MKKHLLLLALTVGIFNVRAQKAAPEMTGVAAPAGIADSARFLLHKFAQNIGAESYTLTKGDSGLVFTVRWKFTDRGSAVPLDARLTVSHSYEPRSLFIKGKTCRFCTINDTVRIRGRQVDIRVDDSAYTQTLAPMSFPVAGYSPGTVQMILLQYWKSHGRPAAISMLPSGTVKIRKDGTDALTFMGRPLLLERYVISGLVWGNELVWTDAAGNLVCLITNDAEGDKLEMMREPYESLMPVLITRAATYGMQLFTAAVGKVGNGKQPLLAIVGGKLIDVKGGAVLENSVILVENGVIKGTGKVGELAVPAGAKVIHAEGQTILPGLWDMHSHFEQAEWGPAYLAAGVTTVRDCGNEYEYINAIQGAIDGGKGIGPRILKAGIIDGPGPMGLGIVRASTKEEAIAAVDKYKENGFVQIKIYSSVTPPIVKAICEEAHRLGLTVTGHIPEGMNLQQGVDSGMNMVNHIQYVYAIMKINKDRSIDFDDSTSKAVIRFLKEHQVVVDPTLGVFEMILRPVTSDIFLMEPAFNSLPLPLQTLFKTMGMPAERAAAFKPMQEALAKLVKVMHDEGIPIVAGTDMGFPGYSVARELELYVAGGLSPLEAIQTATIIPARVMGRAQQSGTLETGKQADLIIVDGNPLTNIRDIRKVRTVIKDGVLYDPVVLHRVAGFQ